MTTQAWFLWYEQGEYSDYSVTILGAYSTLENAQRKARQEEERLYQLEMIAQRDSLVQQKKFTGNVNLGLYIAKIEERIVGITETYEEWKGIGWTEEASEPDRWQLQPKSYYGRTYVAKLFTLDA
jgi:hypothetical protein